MRARRLIASCALAALLLAALAGGAGAADVAPADQSTCIAERASFFGGPQVGQVYAYYAHRDNGLGHVFGPAASSDICP